MDWHGRLGRTQTQQSPEASLAALRFLTALCLMLDASLSHSEPPHSSISLNLALPRLVCVQRAELLYE